MTVSLCGKQPCPRICIRVCHCPAGLARSHELAGMYRNRREISRGRASRLLPSSEARQSQVEFIPEAQHNFQLLNQPQHRKQLLTFPTRYERQTPPPYTKNLKLQTSTAFLIALLIFTAIVVGIGLYISQGDFTPNYEPPASYYYETQ